LRLSSLSSVTAFRNLFLASALLIPMSGLADTITVVSNGFSASPFGNPHTATYGQTFALPGGDGVLNSWTFTLDNVSNPFAMEFMVGTWDTTTNHMTGSALYQSPSVDTTTGSANYTFTPNVTLAPGQEYVAFLTVSNSPGAGTASMPLNSTNAYADGGFFFLNNGTDTSQWTSTAWDNFTNNDAAFTATFSPSSVPEPGTLAMFGTGALGLLGAFRHRLAR
jgi:hypothetical protein